MADSSLRARAVRATAAELVGVAGSMSLRLVSTLVLSRLLFPEAFGLAALVSTFTFGLVMLSDMGLLQSVVQNERGNDPRFLNTAWTMQVVRGLTLWVIACLLAWPLSRVYHEPDLMWLLPVGSFTLVINGFVSTSLFTLRRRLASAQLVRVDLASQAVGFVVVVSWAYWYPSAWAIVAGGLAGAFYKLVISYRIDAGYRNRFEWDSDAKAAIMGFGKWIFAASSLDFVGRHGDRLLLAHYLGVAVLGVYSLAVLIGEALQSAVGRISHSVLFPLLSKVKRDEPHRLGEYFYRARLRLDCFGLVPVGMVAVMSQTVVDIMYDPRYAAAGWMLQVICVRVAMSVVLVPVQTCLFSSGLTQVGFHQNVGRMAWVLVGIPIGWHHWGIQGVVWAAATAELPGMAVLWWTFHRQGLLRLSRELLALGFVAVGLLLGLGADRAVRAVAAHFGVEF